MPPIHEPLTMLQVGLAASKTLVELLAPIVMRDFSRISCRPYWTFVASLGNHPAVLSTHNVFFLHLLLHSRHINRGS